MPIRPTTHRQSAIVWSRGALFHPDVGFGVSPGHIELISDYRRNFSIFGPYAKLALVMKRLTLLLVCLSLAAFGLQADEVRSEVWDVGFPTPDGQQAFATYLQPAREGSSVDAHGVILVHMLGGQRDDWGTLPLELRKAGYAVMVLQLRGHDKREANATHWSRYEKTEFNAMVGDILGARAWLQKQTKTHVKDIAVVGARFGANLGLKALEADDTLKGCYALSAGFSYRGVKISKDLSEAGGRPVRCVASEKDTYGASCAQKFEEAGASALITPASEKRLNYGTELFQSQPDLSADLLNWLKTVF